jgi:hypothetical protein
MQFVVPPLFGKVVPAQFVVPPLFGEFVPAQRHEHRA